MMDEKNFYINVLYFCLSSQSTVLFAPKVTDTLAHAFLSGQSRTYTTFPVIIKEDWVQGFLRDFSKYAALPNLDISEEDLKNS